MSESLFCWFWILKVNNNEITFTTLQPIETHKALYAYNIKKRPKYNKNLFKIYLVKNWVATDKTKHGDL